MNKILLLLVTLSTFSLSLSTAAQEPLNCFEKLEEAFKERGAYVVSDNIHRNVIISFFEEDNNVYCVNAKVRVEDGYITSIFYYYEDGTSELYEKKFTNTQNEPPRINNGISEMITNADGEKLKVIFVEKLKPKQKQLQRAVLPDDL